jgi:hypothetical protein
MFLTFLVAFILLLQGTVTLSDEFVVIRAERRTMRFCLEPETVVLIAGCDGCIGYIERKIWGQK